MKKRVQRKKESLVLGKMLKKIAPQIGASVVIEPEWGMTGRITFKSGRHSYFRYNTLDLNPVGSSDIAKDKNFADYFMRSLGYQTVPDSKTFFSQAWAETIGLPSRTIDAAYRYACGLGFPVVVKPNSGSQGSGVALVYNQREFYTAMRAIFKADRVALVQRPVRGNDYRCVVLDNRVISTYLRKPLEVVGDGRSSIRQLLNRKQLEFRAAKRDTQINAADPRIARKLKHLRLTWRTVLAKGQQLSLLDNANLSTGGEAIDVTANVHPAFKKLVIQLTRDMGLRLCGVDLMVDGEISSQPDKYTILEINAAPGLDHYVKMGKQQERIVEQLYLEVLKHLER